MSSDRPCIFRRLTHRYYSACPTTCAKIPYNIGRYGFCHLHSHRCVNLVPQLKKLINQVVLELSSHGLSPNILQELIIDSKGTSTHHTTDIEADELLRALSKVIYEIESEPDHIVPRLRLLIELPESGSTSPSVLREHLTVHLGATLSEVQRRSPTSDEASITEAGGGGDGDEVDVLYT